MCLCECWWKGERGNCAGAKFPREAVGVGGVPGGWPTPVGNPYVFGAGRGVGQGEGIFQLGDQFRTRRILRRDNVELPEGEGRRRVAVNREQVRAMFGGGTTATPQQPGMGMPLGAAGGVTGGPTTGVPQGGTQPHPQPQPQPQPEVQQGGTPQPGTPQPGVTPDIGTPIKALVEALRMGHQGAGNGATTFGNGGNGNREQGTGGKNEVILEERCSRRIDKFEGDVTKFRGWMLDLGVAIERGDTALSRKLGRLLKWGQVEPTQ